MPLDIVQSAGQPYFRKVEVLIIPVSRQREDAVQGNLMLEVIADIRLCEIVRGIGIRVEIDSERAPIVIHLCRLNALPIGAKP